MSLDWVGFGKVFSRALMTWSYSCEASIVPGLQTWRLRSGSWGERFSFSARLCGLRISLEISSDHLRQPS